MDYTRNLVSVSLIVIGSHLFIHEVVLAIRGIINMFNTTSGNQAVMSAQTNLANVNQSLTSIGTIVTAISTPAAGISTNNINTLTSSFSVKVTNLQNNLAALNSALGSNVSTTAQVTTQANTITSAITDLNSSGIQLFTAINTATAATQASLGQYSNLPGLLNSLQSNWNNSTGSITNAAASLSVNSSLGLSDIITILTGALGFNETQFDKYFKSIAANNQSNSNIAIVIRWIGILMFGFGVAILTNLIKLNFFGIQVGDTGMM